MPREKACNKQAFVRTCRREVYPGSEGLRGTDCRTDRWTNCRTNGGPHCRTNGWTYCRPNRRTDSWTHCRAYRGTNRRSNCRSDGRFYVRTDNRFLFGSCQDGLLCSCPLIDKRLFLHHDLLFLLVVSAGAVLATSALMLIPCKANAMALRGTIGSPQPVYSIICTLGWMPSATNAALHRQF